MKYTIYYQENQKTKKLIVDNLEEKDLPNNIIKIKKNYLYFENKKRLSVNYLKDFLYELSLMLDSKILLSDAFDILINKEKNQTKKSFLKLLKDSFSSSKDILVALERFNINPLVKSFFRITQDSGNPKDNIKALYYLLRDSGKIKKDFIRLFSYPVLLLCSFFLSLIGIFKFVVPSFQSMFSQINIELSFSTRLLFTLKDFYENYFISSFFLLVSLVSLLLLVYKNSKTFQGKIDRFLVVNCLLFSNLYKLKNFYQLFLVMDILLKNNYSFHESLSKAKILMNNQYLLDRITQIENLLKSGKSISFAFESVDLFDNLTISLLKTGEVSNSMQEVVLEIKKIYKQRFDDKLKLFSLLIEPLFLIIMMVLIIWIVLAIFVPLWSMSDMLRV